MAIGSADYVYYILNIRLVFFLAGLIGNRYLTHVVRIGFYIFLLVSFELDLFEEVRFGYTLTPDVEDFLEMNRYGIWAIASFWYFLM